MNSRISRISILLTALFTLSAGWAQDSLGISQLSAVDYWDRAASWQVVGHHAYLSANHYGLRIMDLADPAHPVEIGRQRWAPWCLQDVYVHVQDSLAYVSYFSPGNGLNGSMLNLADPAHPQELHRWATTWSDPLDPTDPYLVFVRGNVAVGLQGSEIEAPFLVDVSDWENPQFAYDFREHGNGYGVMGMVGGYLCLAGGGSIGFSLYDISDPYAPAEVSSVTDTLGRYANLAVLDSSYLYIKWYTNRWPVTCTVHIIDLSDPFHPADVDTFDSGWIDGLNRIGSQLFVHKYDGTISRWNVSDPRHPQWAGTTVLPAGCNDFIGSESRWCALADPSCGDEAVVVLDPSNPAVPVEVSRFGTYGHFEDGVSVSGSTLIVADTRKGFLNFDWSNPRNLHEIGRARIPCVLGNHAFNVAVRGDYAYQAVQHQGVLTYNLANPAQPESLAFWQGEANSEVFLSGDTAYVFCGNFTAALSLVNPAVPQFMDSLPTFPPCVAEGCPCRDGYRYCGGGSGEFIVSSVTDGHQVGWCYLQGDGLGTGFEMAVLSGQYCYVAAFSGGVNVVDVSNPSAPYVVSTVPGHAVTKVALSGQTLVYFDAPQLHVLDISDPVNPQEVGYYDVGGPPVAVTSLKLVDPYALISDGVHIAVYQVDALAGVRPRHEVPHEFALRPAYPNPFNPSTLIRFSLPRTQKATLTVYDVTGRHVQTLVDGVLSVGEHRTIFDGSGLASGVYFVRLEAGTQAKTTKLLLLK